MTGLVFVFFSLFRVHISRRFPAWFPVAYAIDLTLVFGELGQWRRLGSLANCRLDTLGTVQGKFKAGDDYASLLMLFASPGLLDPNAFQGNSNNTRKIIKSKA